MKILDTNSPTRWGRKDLKQIRETFASLHGRVLDVGCGSMIDRVGYTPGDEYIGTDITKSKYATVLADIHKLPFKNESFDTCICNFVLEHVKEPLIVLRECNRVLKWGGDIGCLYHFFSISTQIMILEDIPAKD